MFAQLYSVLTFDNLAGATLALTGLAMLASAALAWASGETSVQDPLSVVPQPLRRDQQPRRFRRAVVMTVFGGMASLLTSAFFLLT